MKTSEFIKEVEKLNFVDGVIEIEILLDVCSKEGLLCRVDKNNYFALDNCFDSFFNLGDFQKTQLMNFVWQYVTTPIELRGDKTIEEKAREYILKFIDNGYSFEPARIFLEDASIRLESDMDFEVYSYEETKEQTEIYKWYLKNPNEFIKIWAEVSTND